MYSGRKFMQTHERKLRNKMCGTINNNTLFKLPFFKERLAMIVISLLPGQARLTTLFVLSLVMMLLMMCLLLFMLLVRKVLLNYFH